jgi:NADH/F420H2 dehydrogenase subunit C
MDNEKLKEKILLLAPGAVHEENREMMTFLIPSERLHALALGLKTEPDLSFDYLFCLCGVDWGKELGVVYHMTSTSHGHTVVLKVKTSDRENPEFDSVCNLWQTAEFHERETYDLLGIRFRNHPDLRRIFLEEDWKGYPLRKDYVDEVNIVEF